jgi:hypothetical protein
MPPHLGLMHKKSGCGLGMSLGHFIDDTKLTFCKWTWHHQQDNQLQDDGNMLNI